MSVFFPAIKSWLLISLSFLGGVVLMFLQRPGWLSVPWMVLILLYWILMSPQHVELGAAWLIGFFLDIVYNVPVGENGLALTIIVYLVVKFRDKIVSLSFWEMAGVVFGLILVYQLLQFLMQVYCGYYFNGWSILSYAITSALIWPFLARLLFNYQLKYRI